MTIRLRITLLAMSAVLLVLAAAGTLLVVTQRRVLTENVDEAVAADSAALTRAVAEAPRGDLPTLGDFRDDDTVAQIVDESGRVLDATANLVGRPAFGPPPANRPDIVRTVDAFEGADAEYRMLSRRSATQSGTVVVHLGSPLDDVDETAAALIISLVVAVPVVTGVLGVVVWWLVGRTLRPVEAIRSEVASIGGAELHRRVPEPNAEDEIARLARTMNDMLERVDHATARERRFVADASHELRGPLTRMRTELEVDLAHPPDDALATHRSVLDEVVAVQRLVDDLLFLARTDSGTRPLHRAPVDLDELVTAAVDRSRAAGPPRVDTRAIAAVRVVGDADQLGRAVGNVVDNAIRHAATAVTVAVEERDGHARVTVIDDGPGIPTPQRERIFERFTRLDEARSARDGGAGLGLAIARDIVDAHGGTITADDDRSGATRFVIDLPVE